ncbi:RNA polymerase sigma factor [Pendulispora albinea]|uniref:RNA polymerase sigma factor n=1 Tax=Pendulispora albinea TaxID=2741071 RepID=A0ABZ2LRA8_9BACT
MSLFKRPTKPVQPASQLEFRAVYDEHFSFVWRSLRRLGVSENDAGDAVQEVFMVVHRRLDDFEGHAKLTTWLFAICMRVAQRRRNVLWDRRHVLSDDGPLKETPDRADDASAILERRQRLALLESILDELPMEQRAVFTLFELDGMSGEEIASLLDIPVGTVHSRLRIARERFRQALDRRVARERFAMGGRGA